MRSPPRAATPLLRGVPDLLESITAIILTLKQIGATGFQQHVFAVALMKQASAAAGFD
jgi:hypothetical protein